MNTIESNPALVSESLVRINEAGKLFPHPVGRTALERWMRTGVRGVRLESLLIGSRRFTSKEAIARFIERTNEQRDTAGNVRRTAAEYQNLKGELGID